MQYSFIVADQQIIQLLNIIVLESINQEEKKKVIFFLFLKII